MWEFLLLILTKFKSIFYTWLLGLGFTIYGFINPSVFITASDMEPREAMYSYLSDPRRCSDDTILVSKLSGLLLYSMTVKIPDNGSLILIGSSKNVHNEGIGM